MNDQISNPMTDGPKKNNTMIIIVVIVVVLCLCCVALGGGYWLWNNGDRLLQSSGAILNLI